MLLFLMLALARPTVAASDGVLYAGEIVLDGNGYVGAVERVTDDGPAYWHFEATHCGVTFADGEATSRAAAVYAAASAVASREARMGVAYNCNGELDKAE